MAMNYISQGYALYLLLERFGYSHSFGRINFVSKKNGKGKKNLYLGFIIGNNYHPSYDIKSGYKLTGYPNVLLPCSDAHRISDTQNIYGLLETSLCQRTPNSKRKKGIVKSLSKWNNNNIYSEENHIEIFLVGIDDYSIYKEDSSQPIPLPPNRTIEYDQSSIIETNKGLFKDIFLPIGSDYSVKIIGKNLGSIVKIFVNSPLENGKVCQINYSKIHKMNNKFDYLSFHVGQENLDNNLNIMTTDGNIISYSPDFLNGAHSQKVGLNFFYNLFIYFI